MSASSLLSEAPEIEAGVILSFRNVSCRLSGKQVVDDVSLDVAHGEIVCLLGPSGCGKTTSLRLAGGMEIPDAGEIWLNGQCASTPQSVLPPEKRGVGFLFQDFALFPHLSVFDNVCFGIGTLPMAERRSRAMDLLEAVGLRDLADKFPDILSGGEQQRVALARALAPRPSLVLMDEPFSSLDSPLRDHTRDLTVRLLKQSQAAGLIVTHDAADALRMADRIAAQKAGRILQIDTPQQIYAHAVSADVATLFGAVNLLAAAQIGKGRGTIGIRPADIALESMGDDFAFTATLIAKRHIGIGWLCALSGGDVGAEGWQALIDDDTVASLALGQAHNFFVPHRRLMLFKEDE